MSDDNTKNHRFTSPLLRIIAIVEAERAKDTAGSDENTEQDLAAYDAIIDVLQEEGLIA